MWAQERGFELPAQPEDEGCAARWLCCAALLRESNPPVRASTGRSHSLFIDGEGRLLSCGADPSQEGAARPRRGRDAELNTPTRLPSPLGGERAVSVAAGESHSIALTADGSAWSWGWGGNGRLGHGDEYQWQLLPRKIEALADQRVVAVSAGLAHSFAITADGAVWSWGDGGHGQLGHGDQQEQLLPKKVEAFADQRVAAVLARENHSLAITADGAVFTWGKGECGCLGHAEDLSNQLLPKKIEVWALG